jgi:3-oxochol-4-en-24-oyl-CoA dehydrogenase
LAEAGYVAPHWPRPWGLGADPVTQLVIDDEMRRAGVRRPSNQIGIGWAGPTLIHAGTESQKQRYLRPLLAAEEIWCQLFSEPGAGSDLAGLSTRAERDGDEWVVTGQKVWTSFAHLASLGILLARTDPDAPKHSGISYFICPMDAPGVTIRPIVDMTGDHAFNEVFLDGVRLAPEHLVGEVNGGWALAKVTLGNERVSLSGEGALWGQGPTAGDLVDLVRRAGGTADRLLRQRLVRVWIEGEILRLIRLRTVSAAVAGRAPGPEASVRKALADDHGQNVMEVAKDLSGAHGLTTTGPFEALVAGGGRTPARPDADADAGAGVPGHVWPGAVWSQGYLFARALTIGGGTAEVQRNIIAERVLGLPSS